MASGIAEEIAKLPATAKTVLVMVYVAYVILTCLGKLNTQPLWVFLAVSVAFLFVEILHNDWCRIRLNNHAEKNRPGQTMPLERCAFL